MDLKKKILITESQFKVLIEQFEDYKDMDFYDAFFIIFKNWIKSNVSEEELNKPISFLMKKYSNLFLRDVMGDSDRYGNYDDDDGINRWDIDRIVKHLVQSGKYTLPSLRKDVFFTEKFKKHIDSIVSSLELPSYASIKLEEKEPQHVEGEVFVDFASWVKDPELRTFQPSTIEKNLKKYFENYLGVEFGNPLYGETKLDIDKVEFVGQEEWKKNIYGKIIRPRIKVLDEEKALKAIRLEVSRYRVEMKLVFNWNRSGYQLRRTMAEKIKVLLRELGFGPNIKVET